MPEVSLILTDDDPRYAADGRVLLGSHCQELVLVDAFPATISIGVFIQVQISPDERGDLDGELWTQDLDGHDHECLTNFGVSVIPSPNPVIPREYEVSTGFECTFYESSECQLAVKLGGVVLARRLLVVWSRPRSRFAVR